MPVNLLIVEGKLDTELMEAIVDQPTIVRMGGSKNSLAPFARTLLKERSLSRVGFLRDRDFDYDPPDNRIAPVPIQVRDTGLSGWHWCRHEIENYLLEPALVAAACSSTISEATYLEQLREAALRIRFYQAARWAVGVGRRSLPPNYDLKTRHPEIADKELAVPVQLSAGESREWPVQTCGAFLQGVNFSLCESAVQQRFGMYEARFNEEFCGSTNEILVWFSGKDLMAAMEDWLRGEGYANAGVFRAELRDWVTGHPEEAPGLLPEWGAFVSSLKQ